MAKLLVKANIKDEIFARTNQTGCILNVCKPIILNNLRDNYDCCRPYYA